jgi:hypothetical protein
LCTKLSLTALKFVGNMERHLLRLDLKLNTT